MILVILPEIAEEDRLLSRARRGDQDAIMRIYEQYFPPIYQYIRLRVDDRMGAEDLASEVFTRFIAAVRAGNAPRSTLRGWLFRVARNLIADHYGASKKLATVALDETLEEWLRAPDDDGPEVRVVRQADGERVRAALRLLNADQQEVLVLRFGQMLDLEATADIMGKSVSAIKSLQFRAVESLRRALERTA
jgi:RNA polymerase sigma-70 factor (ECF subfamily)